MKGRKRCRMHGGTNPGAPKGNHNAWKHGGRSAETLAAARWLRAMAKLARGDEAYVRFRPIADILLPGRLLL